MEPKQMLEAVIEKAIENGYDFQSIDSAIGKGANYNVINKHDIEVADMYISPLELFFNHDFAKAYYGEARSVGEYCRKDEVDGKHCDDWDCKRTEWIMGWKEHLQQAVLSEDPLLYYYQHL